MSRVEVAKWVDWAVWITRKSCAHQNGFANPSATFADFIIFDVLRTIKNYIDGTKLLRQILTCYN
ncbi:hypothetical protein HanIR_Chr16g0814591 [Helianthus annuus]|nr:hypothetical protein HanIR_Chr16g0814591 [Helianthus annuus]